LKRAIQKYIEDLLAEMLVNKQMKEGDKITLKVNEAKDALEAEKTPKKKEKEPKTS
jgi:ATP-dependent Clp protease ATP-binding subunit ClpC